MNDYQYQPKDPTGGCGSCLLVIVVALGLDCLFAWIFQMLWNFAIVAIFALPIITFWQAFALWIIIGLIGGCFKAIHDHKG